eukprot:gene22085-23130_t
MPIAHELRDDQLADILVIIDDEDTAWSGIEAWDHALCRSGRVIHVDTRRCAALRGNTDPQAATPTLAFYAYIGSAGHRVQIARSVDCPGDCNASFDASPVGCLGACGKKSGPPAFPTPEVGFVTLSAGPVTLSTELPGRTSAYMSSEVRPQISGLIKARLFTEGSLVKAGQPLYQIAPSLYSATVQQAAASLANAQANAVTATAKAAGCGGLTDMEAVSKQDKDDVIAAAGQARASVAEAQATLRTARINLAFTRITAPISGRIGRSAYTQGALVTASQTDALATIQRLDPIFVDITQSSADQLRLRQQLLAGKLSRGAGAARVRLKLEDGTLYPVEGV